MTNDQKYHLWLRAIIAAAFVGMCWAIAWGQVGIYGGCTP